MGPWTLIPFLPHQTCQHRNRHRNETCNQDPGKNCSEFFDHWRVAWVAKAETLEQAPDAMIEMKTDKDHHDDINDRKRYNCEPRDQVFVGMKFNEVRVNCTRCQVQQVEDDE